MYPIMITINNAEEMAMVEAALGAKAETLEVLRERAEAFLKGNDQPKEEKPADPPGKEKPAKNKAAKTEPVPTREDINALTLAFIQVNGEGRAREILKSFNAARVSKVKDEDLQAYHDALKSEMPE